MLYIIRFFDKSLNEKKLKHVRNILFFYNFLQDNGKPYRNI